jgi:hypothetical protein
VRTGRRLLAGAVIAATVLTTASATATAQAPPVVAAVSVSPGAVAISGLDTTPVTVSVSLTGNTYGDPTRVYLERTTTTSWDGSAPNLLTGALRRTSGTASAGGYQGAVSVPSSAHGVWRVGALEFGLNSTVDPRDSGLPDATLDVTGTHRPRIRLTISPQPLPYPRHDLTMTARLTYDDTGRPIAGRWVFFGGDSFCAEDYVPVFKARTNARGVAFWHTTIPGTKLLCAWMPLPVSPAPSHLFAYTLTGRFPVAGTSLNATPSRTVVHRRTKTAVNGKALAIGSPSPVDARTRGVQVVLQRLVGRHWRNVSETKVRSSGRFTLYASPPPGRNYYRAALPEQSGLGASTTKAFVIRGT